MNMIDLQAISPFVAIVAASLVVMIGISFSRNLAVVALLTVTGLSMSLGLLFTESAAVMPRQATQLLILDRFSLLYVGLILSAAICVAIMSYAYLKDRSGAYEEFFLLLLFASLGGAVLAASNHFVSFFLGLEVLSVALYGLIAYPTEQERPVEAGLKYLILAGASSAILLFGMALVYAELGTLSLSGLAARAATAWAAGSPALLGGLALIIAAVGFKLALVPFHLWTPDVYEGAPAPVSAFIATVSKGAVFAILLRTFKAVDLAGYPSLATVFTVLAIASMFCGNLLALFQNNIKRVLAYSSISHMGYLIVAFLASGVFAPVAVSFYLAAYFATTLGAFGIVALLSGDGGDTDSLDAYRGLSRRRPWLAAAFALMLFSLAGIPLTAGFVGKFLLVAAGAESSLWLLVSVLVLSSVIGLFYYLRIIAALFESRDQIAEAPAPVIGKRLSPLGACLVALLAIMLLWIGIFPQPLLEIIRAAVAGIV
jgi:NADH-quinone oxidoreductase subunit N